MVVSGCQQVWELLLGSGDVVNLDSGDVVRIVRTSSYHDSVLKFNCTSQAENEDIYNIPK